MTFRNNMIFGPQSFFVSLFLSIAALVLLSCGGTMPSPSGTIPTPSGTVPIPSGTVPTLSGRYVCKSGADAITLSLSQSGQSVTGTWSPFYNYYYSPPVKGSVDLTPTPTNFGTVTLDLSSADFKYRIEAVITVADMSSFAGKLLGEGCTNNDPCTVTCVRQ